MDYVNKHKERKAKVLALLTQGAEKLEKAGFENDANALHNLIEQTNNGKFSIVVVGTFSAGKSTLLNAMMGERYLPSYTKETTATINFIESADYSPTGRPMFRVKYYDGHHVDIADVSLDNLDKYVSVNGDNVAKSIESVHLYLEGSKFLNDGVCLIDSPGLQGVAEGHAEITQAQIDKSHAAIFMFNAHQSSGTLADFQTLKMLKDKRSRIFIVINQIDIINFQEGQTVESVVQDLKDNYHKYFPEDPIPEIYPIAAWPALVRRSSSDLQYNNENCSEEKKDHLLKISRIEMFENRLLRYLVDGEKTIDELTEPIVSLVSMLDRNLNACNRELEILSNEESLSELQQRKDSLQEEVTRIESDAESQKFELSNQFMDIIDDAKEKLKANTKEIAERYENSIEMEDDLDDMLPHINSLITRINSEYQMLYADCLNSLRKDFKATIKSTFDKLTSEANARINSIKFDDAEQPTFTIDIDDSIFTLDIDMHEIDSEIDNVSKMRDNLETQIDSLETSVVQADKIEDKRDKIEDEYREAIRQGQIVKSNLGSRPNLEQRNRLKRKTGWMQNVKEFFGADEKWVNEYYYDDSAQKEWDRNMAELQEEKIAVEHRYSEKMAKLSNCEDSDILRGKLSIKKRELDKIDARLKSLYEKYDIEIERKRGKAIRKAKQYLRDSVSMLNKQGRSKFLSSIDELGDMLNNEAIEIVKANLSNALNQKIDELSRIEVLITAQAEEKDKRRHCLTELIDDFGSIKSQAETLKTEFDNIETDIIIESI